MNNVNQVAVKRSRSRIRLGVVCSVCNQIKEQRTWKFNNAAGFIKVDPSGSRWDGDVCPDCKLGCKRDAITNRVREEREKNPKRDLLGPDTPLQPPKVRPCRSCGVGMVDRYFYCRRCEERDYGFLDEVEVG